MTNVKLKIRALGILTLGLALTACEAGHDGAGASAATQAAPTPAITPTQTASVVKAAPSIESTWITTNISYDDPSNHSLANPALPQNQMLGTYIGNPTNGPQFTLDLSKLHTGVNTGISIPYDATHNCNYDIVLSSVSYNVTTLDSCTDDTTGNVDLLHCDYCPINGGYTNMNWIFDYSISASGTLTLTDSVSGQSESYTVK